MRILIAISLLIVLFTGCKKAEERKCFKKLGDMVTEERSVSPFTTIELNDFIDLVLVKDTEQWLEITTGKNIISFITTTVENGTLTIRDENTCNFLRNLSHKTKVKIHTPDIAHLVLRGSGDVITEGVFDIPSFKWDLYHANGNHFLQLACDSVSTIVHTGVPEIVLDGTTDYSYFYYFGNGNTDASRLDATTCIIGWNSTGNLQISAQQSIYGEILSSGNVYYYNNPSIINVDMLNSGRLIDSD